VRDLARKSFRGDDEVSGEVRAMAGTGDKQPEWPEKVGNAIGTVVAALILLDLLYAPVTHFM
jgi:hypothetical protein